jgi:DNA-binding beta-propeller fold protein YncE
MKKDILIVNQKSAHTIGYFEVDSGKAIKQIKVDNYPHEFVIDSQQKYIYVGHYGVENSGVIGDHGGCSIFVIDIASGEHVHTISTWPYYRIHGLALDNQDRLYAMSESQNVLMIFEHPHKAKSPDRAIPSGGLKTHLFSLTKDGQVAFCLNLLSHTVTRIKPWDPTYQPDIITPGRKPEGNCLSPDQRFLYVSNRLDNEIVSIDTNTLDIVARASTKQDPTRCYISPNKDLLVTNYGGRSISVFSLELTPLYTLDLPADPIAISFHPQINIAYISMINDQIAIIDLCTHTIIKTFPCLEEPDVSFLITLK